MRSPQRTVTGELLLSPSKVVIIVDFLSLTAVAGAALPIIALLLSTTTIRQQSTTTTEQHDKQAQTMCDISPFDQALQGFVNLDEQPAGVCVCCTLLTS